MAAYTTTLLLSSIERKSFSPANQATFTSADILAMADEVVKTRLLPAIVGAREEFYLTYKDYSITSGTAAYAIPPRAVGLTCREIHIVDSSGRIQNLPRFSVDRLHLITGAGDSGSPRAFYLQGDDIVLVPSPSVTASTLRVYYYIRPGDLVPVSSGAVISAINTTTNVVSVTTIPSTWSTGNVFDLIQRNGSHKHLSLDLTSTLVSGTDITLPSLPSSLAVGDYICLAGESCLVQMPPDFHSVLASLTAAEMIGSMDQAKAEKLIEAAEKQLSIASNMLNPRVVGEDEVILPDFS